MKCPRSGSAALAATLLAATLVGAGTRACAQARWEIRPVATTTLSNQQILTGTQDGTPATIAGELRIPKPGTDRLPAVILVHGSAGIGAHNDRWAQELNSIGVATFVLDGYSGRGIFNTMNDQSQLGSLAMIVDVYRALASLARHPRIDPNRIAVMGFSLGAKAAVYSSNERFRKIYGPKDVTLAAHIGLYTPCDVAYRDDANVTGKPIRLFHGAADDYVSVEPCRAYVARLKSAGADAVLTEYPGAYHVYDAFFLREAQKMPQAQKSGHCAVVEGDAGELVNSATGKPWNWNDACVERGATIGPYNAEATAATEKAVKSFLAALWSKE